MTEGLHQASPTSPDSGISSGSSHEDLNSAKKDGNVDSPKDNTHFTFPRATETHSGMPYTAANEPPSLHATPVITVNTSSNIPPWNVAYHKQLVAPTGIATSVVQRAHVKTEIREGRSDDEGKNLICSDEEFSDDSNGSEEFFQGNVYLPRYSPNSPF